QQGQVAGRAKVLTGVKGPVALELHEHPTSRQQRRHLPGFHQPRLDLRQLAVENLLQLLLAGHKRCLQLRREGGVGQLGRHHRELLEQGPLWASSAWLRWMSCSRPWRFSRVNSARAA
ncbi:MAG: hypothetical protein ACK56I_34315, partial [bacterium]